MDELRSKNEQLKQLVMEIIRLVETSELSVKQTLQELGVPRSTFYDWYRRYCKEGLTGLSARPSRARQFWNRIPDSVREHVVEVALEKTELSPRQLAWHITAISSPNRACIAS